MRQEYQDSIVRYLLGQMSDKERNAFEQQIDSNEELREQMNISRDVQKAFESRGRKMAAISAWRGDYSWKKNIGSTHLLYWLTGIAAIVIAGVFLLNIETSGSDVIPEEPDGNGLVRGGVGCVERKELTASIICSARYSHGEEPSVETDWLWHDEMMAYGQNLDSIEHVECMNTYDNQPGMNHLAFVSATIAWLKLVGMLKETVKLCENDWMKEAYKLDYQIWLEIEKDLLAMNVENYSAWPQDAYNVSKWLAELRRELLEEEIVYLREEDRCDWKASTHLFSFDCSDRLLEKWYKSRMEIAEKNEKDDNARDFRMMTNKIAYRYKKQKQTLEWYQTAADDD